MATGHDDAATLTDHDAHGADDPGHGAHGHDDHGHDDHGHADPGGWVLIPLAVGAVIGIVLLVVFGIDAGAVPLV